MPVPAMQHIEGLPELRVRDKASGHGKLSPDRMVLMVQVVGF
ncbi:hypothetical protein [Botryobacter ruber]|nr:hypothetical protein [Botryobacter ruber]